MSALPTLRQTVLDATRPRELAEFYRRLLGLRYRAGDEMPDDPAADEADWLVLVDEQGAVQLAVQGVAQMAAPTWPEPEVPQQLHLDITVETAAQLGVQRERALDLGAVQLRDRSEDLQEPLYVFADPAGHPFCIFVS